MRRKQLTIGVFCLALFLAAGQAGAEWYTMRPGDTLWDLAGNKYGDPNLYKVLGEYNKITNPRAIPVGKQIWLPEKGALDKMKNTGNAADRLEIMDEARQTQDAADPPAQSVYRDPASVLDVVLQKGQPQVTDKPRKAKPGQRPKNTGTR